MKEDIFFIGIKALIPNSEKKILLLKRDYWDLPGGRMNKGETFIQTLLRETEEETGIKDLADINFFTVTLSNKRIPYGESDAGLVLHVYICKTSSSVISISLSEEHREFGWFTLQEAAELLKVKYPVEFTDALLELSL